MRIENPAVFRGVGPRVVGADRGRPRVVYVVVGHGPRRRRPGNIQITGGSSDANARRDTRCRRGVTRRRQAHRHLLVVRPVRGRGVRPVNAVFVAGSRSAADGKRRSVHIQRQRTKVGLGFRTTTRLASFGNHKDQCVVSGVPIETGYRVVGAAVGEIVVRERGGAVVLLRVVVVATEEFIGFIRCQRGGPDGGLRLRLSGAEQKQRAEKSGQYKGNKSSPIMYYGIKIRGGVELNSSGVGLFLEAEFFMEAFPP